MPTIVQCLQEKHYNFNDLWTKYQEDSGGSLSAFDGSNHEIVGVVSSGKGCGRVNVPEVYAKVTSQLNWIHQIAVSESGQSCPRSIFKKYTSIPVP